jgi:hypothetical protein
VKNQQIHQLLTFVRNVNLYIESIIKFGFEIILGFGVKLVKMYQEIKSETHYEYYQN